MSLSNQQYLSLRGINMTVSSMSILGSLFVVAVYIFGRSIRSYPLRLVCYMAISNLLLSITYVTLVQETSGTVCTAQGFLINLSQLSSLIWTVVFSYCLLMSIQERSDEDQEPKSLESFEWWFLLAGYGLPLVLSIIPLFGRTRFHYLDMYTDSRYYCWIGSVNDPINILEQLFEFYLPLFITLVFSLYVTLKVWLFERQHRGYLGRLYVYPIILIVCWSPKLITRALLFEDIELFWLDSIDVIFGGLLGLANAIAYGTNKAVIGKVTECCISRPYSRDSLQNTIELTEKEGPYRTKSKSCHEDSYTKMGINIDRKYSTEV